MSSDGNGNYFSFYDSADEGLDKVTHIDNKLYFANYKFAGNSKFDYANGFTYNLAQIGKSKPECLFSRSCLPLQFSQADPFKKK